MWFQDKLFSILWIKIQSINKESMGFFPGLRRSPGEGKGYPLQYSVQENSMYHVVLGVAKSRTQLRDFHFLTSSPIQSLLVFSFVRKWCLQLLNFLWNFEHNIVSLIWSLFNISSDFWLLNYNHCFYYLQFSSVAQLCPTLCDPRNCSTPGLPVHHNLPEITETHVHWDSDAIQPSHPLLSPFPPAPNPSQHQSLFQWVNSLHEVAKVLEFQL